MDKRMYKFVGVQLVDENVDLHLSKNRYWFDLQNKKGLGNFTVFALENEMSAKDILQLALESEDIQALGLIVIDNISTRIDKIAIDETRLANKGKIKRGRKPAIKTVEAEDTKEEMSDQDLLDIVTAGSVQEQDALV